mmetsp:Transcript_70626/g.132167  ORF Transcript_70626/g.132167 Transcript_70626/m.132167 type:complete len:327 (-) Transcript_70626:1023-2003(-)
MDTDDRLHFTLRRHVVILPDRSHELHPLVILNGAIAITVKPLHDAFYDLCADLLAPFVPHRGSCQNLFQITLCNGASVANVESFESCPDGFFLLHSILPQASRTEFGVVHGTRSIKVKLSECLPNLPILAAVLTENLSEPLGDLLKGQYTIPIRINLAENLVHVPEVLMVELTCHGCNTHCMENRAVSEVMEVGEHPSHVLGFVSCMPLLIVSCNPWMVGNSLNGQTLLRISTKQSLHKILCFIRDHVPRWPRHRESFRQGSRQLLPKRTPERWLSAKHHVGDHSQTPEVAIGSVLLSIANSVKENLRGCIGRTTNNGSHPLAISK